LPPDQRVVYFITICTADRRRVLNNPQVFAAVKNYCATNINWQTLAAVIMPDHLHALVSPLDRDARVTQFSAGLKRFVVREINPDWKWQDGVFDRLMRREESAESKWLYLRENPVRAGLVSRWGDWPYHIGLRNDGGEDRRPTNGTAA
jgi:REP element-mobilizing transposase RayT